MILAEMVYQQEYAEFHHELVAFIKVRFSNIEYGLQGDSWIWIFENDEKVAIDTFSSMKHQIKSSAGGRQLASIVIDYLKAEYTIVVYDTPELEVDDEEP